MSLSSACRRSAAGLLCALGAALATAGPAAAGAPDQTWNCRASAAYVAVPARDRVEPVVANGSSKTATQSPDRARCADDAGSPADTASDLGLRGPAAETTVSPDRGLAVDQSVTAKSSVADFAPGAQGLNLVVHGAHSEATATCTPSGPSLSGSSQVPLVSLNGQVIDITPVEQTVEQLPTGRLVKIKFNEQTRSGNTLTQRAVHLEVQDPAGRVVKDVVVAEARVAGGSEVCDRAAQEATSADADGTGGPFTGSRNPCITGAEYDAARNMCVITRERDGNLANGRETVTTVGRPYAGPSGGRVALPSEAPKSARKSTCLKGKGVKFLVLGTKRSDHITGSNRPDVIFGLGGKDKISGGRGNDCIVGGKGNDRLAGAQGKDKLFGGSGRDKLDGGSEADKLSGGSGRDYINSANGRDKVSGGKGNDAINVSTAGPAARVKCGKGKDIVRYNHNERRRIKGCERRYTIK
jgi:RTX calcium-binding nonapeptide repeat (4 copies)